jgi:hypothetical protein
VLAVIPVEGRVHLYVLTASHEEEARVYRDLIQRDVGREVAQASEALICALGKLGGEAAA